MTPEHVPQAVDEPLVMDVTPVIEPGGREQFLGALHEVLPPARAEAACVHLDVEEVLQLPCFRKHLEISEPLCAVPRAVLVLSPIQPQGARA